MRVLAYLDFNGRCEEALEFYKKALGAKVPFMMRFGESPDPNSCAPGSENKIMHSSMQIGDSEVFASDGRCTGSSTFSGISLTLSVKSDDEADRYFKALSEGGQPFMPLTQTFFASKFGVATDKFGVTWMVINPTER